MNKLPGKKWQGRAILIEFTVSAGIGTYYHWVLHYREAAYIIFGFGILLSLATYLLNEKVVQTSDALREQYQHAHEITFAAIQIKDTECYAKAREVLTATKKTLELLKQGFIPLNEIEFYLEATRAIEQSKHQVKAVDPLTIGWDKRGALLNYYQANVKAIKQGVRITRIFVVNRRELRDTSVQSILDTQLQDNIDVRVACLEELTFRSDLGNYGSFYSSFDFAVYDDKVVADRSDISGNYFGKKTSRPFEVNKYLRLFELIEHHAHKVVLTESGEGIYMPPI